MNTRKRTVPSVAHRQRNSVAAAAKVDELAALKKKTARGEQPCSGGPDGPPETSRARGEQAPLIKSKIEEVASRAKGTDI